MNPIGNSIIVSGSFEQVLRRTQNPELKNLDVAIPCFGKVGIQSRMRPSQ
jgi:hypothetical protein